MKHLLLSAVFVLAACAPQPVPRAIIPAAPTRTAPAAPAVAAARSTQAAAGAVSERLEGQVETLRRAAGELQDGMAEAVLEADRLRRQKSAGEAELNALWEKLTGLQARNLFLEREAETAVATAGEQKRQRTVAEMAVTELTALTVAQEAELSAYRQQYEDLSTAYQTSEKARAVAEAARASADKQAAVGNYLRRCLFGLVALIAAYFVIRLAIPRLGFP